MKFLLALLVIFVAGASASPRKYSFVSTEQFHDDLSDDDMHPDPELPENENTKFMKKNPKVHQDEVTTAYWLNNAKSFVEQQAQRTPNTKKAKNIIMFLGDGMSHPTVAAARVYIGGEDKKLAFENLPYTASSKTYCVDYQVGDSACTATAYLSGVKTNDGMIGVSARGLSGNCEDAKDPTKITESIAVWAMREGKEAGVVTTTRITHASPAGVYGHVTDRDFENDYNVKYYGCDPDLVDDIAEQMVHGDGMNLKVMLGGGSRSFVDQTMTENDRPGYRTDGKNLIDEWKAMEPERVFVNNKQDMLNVPSDVHKLFGLFHTDHIPYNIDILRDGLQDDIPSLTDMTVKAIEILSQNEEGFFLFVEGGRIDHGHHATQAKHALDETAEFSKAIEAALGMIDLEETLVVVTADHSHVMTMAGYADRGNDIFGMAGAGTDSMPYMTLSYANGPGFSVHTDATGRLNPETMDRTSNAFRFPATVPLSSETHGGDDVGIWAAGPWAHLFQGTVEQNVIPHIMAYASCIGNGLRMCD